MKKYIIRLLIFGIFVGLTSCSMGYTSSIPAYNSGYNTNPTGGSVIMNGNNGYSNGYNYNYYNRGYYASSYNVGFYNQGGFRNQHSGGHHHRHCR